MIDLREYEGTDDLFLKAWLDDKPVNVRVNLGSVSDGDKRVVHLQLFLSQELKSVQVVFEGYLLPAQASSFCRLISLVAEIG